MTKEQQIKQYMESLQISREEAEQLWQDDQDDVIGEEGEKLQAKANEVKPKADRKKRVATPKERKVDYEKLELLQTIAKCIETHCEVEVEIEKEVALHFSCWGNEYSIKLTKHRPQKKG